MARGAAMARVEVADFPGAAAELQGLWSFAHDDDGAEGALKAARVDTDAVRDALAELSLDAFPRLATTEPQRALRLLEQARHMPHDLEPRVVHDRAVAALGACLAEGDHPRAALITSLGRAIDQLFADHAALAHFRLRRLELAGASPPPPGDFEAEARAQAVETVAAYLAYLLERGQGARVRQAIEPWQGEARSGSFGDGLRRAADAVRAELHEALGLMDGKLASVRRAVEAVAVWEALDARLSLLLARLRDLRAEPSMVDACEDAAARCLDGFSVHVFNTVARGPLPLQIIERALGLAHANHLREHLLANRSLMGGAS
jgi:hypothetical protein